MSPQILIGLFEDRSEWISAGHRNDDSSRAELDLSPDLKQLSANRPTL